MSETLPGVLRWHASGLAGRSEELAPAAIDSQPAKAIESCGPAGHDAGVKIQVRRRRVAPDVERFPIVIDVLAAAIQDRYGAAAVALRIPEKVAKLWADGGYRA